MTVTPALAVAPSGIDQMLAPAQLLRTARLFAADPALASLVDPDDEEARWVELDSRPHFDVWLLSWPAGTHNEWHDHGEVAGAFQVVSGSLLEQSLDGSRREFRTIMAGQGRSFGQNHIHQFANVRNGPALSVHVYAPGLSTMTRYEITPTGLQSTAAAGAELRW